MMGENDMVYGDYYSYDNSWSVAPPDYGAGVDPSCQFRQPVEEDYRYGTYAWVSLCPDFYTYKCRSVFLVYQSHTVGL